MLGRSFLFFLVLVCLVNAFSSFGHQKARVSNRWMVSTSSSATRTGALPVTSDYLELLLNRVPMIDVRAPIEFEAGALPFAINLALLSDSERHRVGICYKQSGQDAAIKLGHKIVSGSVRTDRVSSWKKVVDEHPNVVLYCARGGLRSQTSQQWLAEEGVFISRVEGGFQSLRSFMTQYLSDSCSNPNFLLLSGMTGTGKTDMLKSLRNGISGVSCMDLEGYANHKGSSFGAPLDAQPPQIDFEHNLVLDLIQIQELRRREGREGRTVLEDESSFLGRRHVPIPLVKAMRVSPRVVVEVPFEERIEKLWNEYVVGRYSETYEYFIHKKKLEGGKALEIEQLEEVDNAFGNHLRGSLSRIKKRLSKPLYDEIMVMMDHALLVQHIDGFAAHRHWLRIVTAEYYDKMYTYTLEKQKDSIVFTGSKEEVLQFLVSSSSTIELPAGN